MIVQSSDDTLVRYYSDTKVIDLSEFANKIITISQATNIGTTVLGQWKMIGDGIPSPDLYYDLSLKSNEHPTRNIIDDMSGNGRHATIYNAMYAKGSGYGKYAEDFMSRFYTNSRVTIKEKTTSSITISKLIKGRGTFEFERKGQWNTHDFKGYSIKVEGYPPNMDRIEFYITVTGIGNNNQRIAIKGNGVYTLKDQLYQQQTEESLFYHGLLFYTDADVDCNLTITQIPEYEGAFVFDGIDDYASIGNMTKGFKTLFLEVVPISIDGILYDQRLKLIDESDWTFAIYNPTAKVAYNERNHGGVTYINGNLNKTILADNLIEKRQVITIVNNTDIASKNGTLGASQEGRWPRSNMALYKVIGFYDELTPAQIQKVITKYNLKYEQI